MFWVQAATFLTQSIFVTRHELRRVVQSSMTVVPRNCSAFCYTYVSRHLPTFPKCPQQQYTPFPNQAAGPTNDLLRHPDFIHLPVCLKRSSGVLIGQQSRSCLDAQQIYISWYFLLITHL
jgi:hypothetical protein